MARCALRGTHMHNATAEGRAAVSSLTAAHSFSDPGAVELDSTEALALDDTARRAASTFGFSTGPLGGSIMLQK